MKTLKSSTMFFLMFASIFFALDVMAQEFQYDMKRVWVFPLPPNTIAPEILLGAGAKPENCRDKCLAEGWCKSFSLRLSDGTCQMGSTVPAPVPMKGFVTGVISSRLGATIGSTPVEQKELKKYCPPLAYTSTSPLPPTAVGAEYQYQLKTSGGVAPITFRLNPSTGQLGPGDPNNVPLGLSMNQSGLIKGQAAKAMYYHFEVEAKDSCENGAQFVKKTFYLLVNPQ